MNKKPYKQFYHGKGITNKQFGQKPMKWFPWTYLDTYNAKTGKFRSRRKFGSDGWAYKDMDTADNHKPYDHVHDIRKGYRFDDRKPNKAEKKEFKKAKKKRRFL
ncbi:MAG: hypothetical protein IKC48_01605 [Clostridia bacterium]|nr:hypothetical protein [Clostridia bacterium]